MGNTPGGLPWPDPDAFVHEGDDAIHALADGVDPELVAFNLAASGIVLGNGQIEARYRKVGREIDLYWLFILGSTSQVTGDVVVPLPVPARAPRNVLNAFGRLSSSGAVYSLVAANFSGSSGATSLSIRYQGTNGQAIALGPSAPGTWASGGWLMLQGRYDTATPAPRADELVVARLEDDVEGDVV